MKKPSTLSVVMKFLVAVPVMMAVIFWPAGTLGWIEGWVYLVLQLGTSTGLAVYFLKHDPELIQKRMEMKMPPHVWDRIIMVPFVLSMASVVIVPGFDAVRFGWSQVPVWLEATGFVGFLGSMWMLFLVMKVNSFLAKTVEIQKGHKVVTTGPYGVVRHPMYSAVLVMVVSISLGMGSWYALIPAGLTVLFLAVRISWEEKMLKEELSGYEEYMKKVRFRLVPGIW
ncbi:isoprenylcysteine carboxylmethyltransferase family protein [Patescibacteria group bacterium]|nr:isoprenylcysteine carboxylmethyltransferase family protein [Patescibacteria group bacterium]